jgi:hypothetical protein
MKKLGIVFLVTIGFVAGLAYTYNCGGGGSSADAAQTRYLHIPAAAFIPTTDGLDFNYEGNWKGSRVVLESGAGNFVAPVILPDDAIVEKMTAHFYDGNLGVGDDIDFLLYETDVSGTFNTTMMASVTSSGSGYGSSSTTAITDPTIDTANKYYQIYAMIPDTALYIFSVKIDYYY